MCPKSNTAAGMADPAHRGQRGFAIVSAIFLLVVLGALGAFMVTFSTVQHTTSAQDVQGSRAYQAARAGMEWGAYQVLTPEHTNLPAGQAPYVCPAGKTPLTLGGSLAGFSVQVECRLTTFTEGGNQIGVYQITSTATFGTAGSSNYVERQLSAAINACRIGGAPCGN